MARPQGYQLDRSAFDDLLVERRLTMTEVAARCGMPLTTLSSLRAGDSKASMKTVRILESGLDIDGETLFPELAASETTEVAS